ncbi:MAG: pyrroline-5-carboxylate reductase [Tepidimonas sp.]|uniref:pyrroline-5-carboxylate reductase n=1 Tax=Tepidimonas sp. TaxID=2002775 RepID=UPI00298F3194|nr:pyrroline-5-carboxylate reductase [Tepidimonas sp.]MCS6811339.1 pyrroline-5-carboxylate reductase [Tepidimonas sp.]MDW8335522.1 pyrroline-5-carboxylate reductase [Tepidimonas sp.]
MPPLPPRIAPDLKLAFIGGGNMATALIGALVRAGHPGAHITVVDPDEAPRARLQRDWGVVTLAAPSEQLRAAQMVVWAVKPQQFRDAAQAAAPWIGQALQLSVAAGIRCASIAAWTQAARIVRAMPNTPALIGQGMTGLYATAQAHDADRTLADAVLALTGERLWVEDEALLDAVTALSGSGPAYVFYVLEAMREAGCAMGLTSEQALRLAIGTLAGAAQLAREAGEPPEVLRARVTSKGGTTAAALDVLQARGVQDAFVAALQAARRRAAELADLYGAA